MNDTDKIVAFVRAMVDDEDERASVLQAQLEDVDKTEFATAVAALFFSAVEAKFNEDTDVREISAFVQETRDRYEDGDEIDPRICEAAIRAVFGEDRLLEGVDPNVLVESEMTLTYSILSRMGWTKAEKDTFFNDTRDMLRSRGY